MSRQQHADLEQIDRRVEQVQGRLGTVQEENSKLKEQERALQRQRRLGGPRGLGEALNGFRHFRLSPQPLRCFRCRNFL